MVRFGADLGNVAGSALQSGSQGGLGTMLKSADDTHVQQLPSRCACCDQVSARGCLAQGAAFYDGFCTKTLANFVGGFFGFDAFACVRIQQVA